MVTGFTVAGLEVVRGLVLLRLSTRVDITAEAAMWGRLLKLPAQFFRSYESGELANRLQGLESLKTFINGNYLGAVFNTVFSMWSVVLMCYYSLKLTFAAVVVWLLWLIVTAYLYRQVINFQRGLIKARNRESAIIQQLFAGITKVRKCKEVAFNLWSKYFGQTWSWNLKLRWQGNYNQIIGSVQPFILTMILYYVALSETQNNLTYATFLAFSAAYTSFNGALNSLIPLVAEFFTIQPSLENLRPILDCEAEAPGEKPDADLLSGAITVKNLNFAYQPNVPILKDISFEIRAGENVALVGKSGCGKSTLVKLLLGFEQPTSGAILYDNQDISAINLTSLRAQLGVVLQNGQIMTGDIFTNIVGTSNLTQEDAWAAAAAAGLAEDIAQMPMGMQTVTGCGEGLRGDHEWAEDD